CDAARGREALALQFVREGKPSAEAIELLASATSSKGTQSSAPSHIATKADVGKCRTTAEIFASRREQARAAHATPNGSVSPPRREETPDEIFARRRREADAAKHRGSTPT